MTISAAWLRSSRRVITGCTALALATGLTLASGTGPASASTRQVDEAGYHFSAPKGTLTVHGSITVPKISCGSSGAHQLDPEVFIRYYAGSSLTVASVGLALSCDLGIPIYGYASLEVDNHTKTVPNKLRPGETVGVTITVESSGATAEISYSSTSSASLREAGGRPYDSGFALTLLNPPSFTPVKYAGCTVNHKTLGSFRPGMWVAVNSAGQVIAIPSGLSGGTTFTIKP
jgi:hypothetical protein